MQYLFGPKKQEKPVAKVTAEQKLSETIEKLTMKIKHLDVKIVKYKARALVLKRKGDTKQALMELKKMKMTEKEVKMMHFNLFYLEEEKESLVKMAFADQVVIIEKGMQMAESMMQKDDLIEDRKEVIELRMPMYESMAMAEVIEDMEEEDVLLAELDNLGAEEQYEMMERDESMAMIP